MILFIPSFAPLKLSCKFSPVVNLSLMRGSIHPTQPFPWLLSSIHSHLTHFLFSFFSYPSSKNSWNTWIQWHWFDWLASRTEQYFELNGTRLEFKVMMALVCMEESALYWLRWLRHRHPNLTWEQFSLELVNRYNIDIQMNPFERLVAVKQTDSVYHYINEFETQTAQVPNLLDTHSQEFFLMAYVRRYGFVYATKILFIFHAPCFWPGKLSASS